MRVPALTWLAQVAAAREEVALLQAELREERARQAAHAATVALVARYASDAPPAPRRAASHCALTRAAPI